MTETEQRPASLPIRAIERISKHKTFVALTALCGGLATVIGLATGTFRVGEVVMRLIYPPPPLSITLSQRETRPLDGHPVINHAQLGKIYAGGAVTRVVLQSDDSQQPIQVDRLIVDIERREIPPGSRLDYKINARRQPGFGTGEVRRSNVVFSGSSGESTYLEHDRTLIATFPNILPTNPNLVLRLDQEAGLQEAIDVTLAPLEAGLYQIGFRALVTIEGKEREFASQRITIFKK